MDQRRKDATGTVSINHLGRSVISRREFLELGLAAGAAGLLLDPKPSTAQPTPKRGGVVRVAVPSAARRLDPAITGSNDEYVITQAIYNNLVRVDHKLTPRPELATDWKVSPDGKVWTFTLRQGVKFHHGREFTSKDAEFTIRRLLNPATASPGRSLLEVIKGIETPDAHTIRFALGAPYSDFPMMFGTVYSRILPFDAADDLIKKPTGTGPFKMKEFVPADHVTMVRNPDYWETGPGGNRLPYVDELRQVTIPEQAAQIAALTGGSIDILLETTVQSIPTLRNNPNVTVIESPSPSYHAVTLLVDRPPFNDPRVRLALKYTVDREQMVKAVLGGYGVPANDHPISTVNPFWFDQPVRKRDIEKAKALLNEAGYGGGLDQEVITSAERPGLVEFAVALKEMSAPAGFRMQLKVVPWDVYTGQYDKKHNFTMQPWNGRATIDESLYPFYHSKGSYNNEFNYTNKEIDTLLEAGRAEGNVAKRKDIYGRVQKILTEDGPEIIPYHRPYLTAIHKRVQNYQVHPLRFVDVRATWLS